MSGALGKTIKQADLDALFLSGPTEALVPNTLMQMGSVSQFTDLFGPYTPGSNQQRWADYARFDWNIRQLPVINIYEAETEEKISANAWLNGAVNILVLWPPNQRRSDLARVPVTFKGAIQNFFQSQLAIDMLDELYWIVRPAKVPGLNEYGKVITWAPNVEGFVEDQQVPVTLLSVKYRIDLRAWYRWMEFQNRTVLIPFTPTLGPLTVIGGNYEGVTDTEGQDISVQVPDEITVSSP